MALYKHVGDLSHIQANLNQGHFGRSYKTGRSAVDALTLVVDWIWTKHNAITGENQPPEQRISSLAVEDREFLLSPPLGQLVRGKH